MSAEERMADRAARIRQLILEHPEMVEHANYPPRHHGKGEVCLRAITTGDCPRQHDYHGEPADRDEIEQMRWARAVFA